LLVMMVLVGCGGAARERTPSEKCDDLVDSVCDRAVVCIAGASGMHSACVEGIKSLISCAAVKSVGAGYDRCMDRIDSDSCTTLFPVDPDTGDEELVLPADCSMVLVGRTATDDVISGRAMSDRLSEAVGLAH
jgi:hypothetical protein